MAEKEALDGMLEDRFRRTDADGIYVGHQPIYGFRKGHCEGMTLMRYTITYQVMKTLAALDFSEVADIGGAEGYKSALIRKTFGAKVYSCDYSSEANHRAKEIFDVDGEAVDVTRLPFQDGRFEVVVCSETLEHIPDIRQATRELLRVARRAVVITVPMDPPERIARNLANKADTFPHCHALDPHSFDWTRELGVEVHARTCNSHLMSLPFKIVEAEDRHKPRYTRLRLFLHNTVLMGTFRFLFGRGAVANAIRLDDWASKKGASGKSLVFILVKDPTVLRGQPLPFRPETVLDFSVPFYRMEKAK